MTSPPPWVSDYIGIPWKPGGRARDGLDCYGIMRLAFEERGGITFPLLETVGASDLMRVHDEIDANLKDWRRVEIGKERAWDVLQINRTFKHLGRFVSRPIHLGLVVEGGKVLHAEGDGAAGVVLANLDDMRRVTHAAWRHKTMCSGQEGPDGSPFDCRRFVVEPGSSIADIVALSGIDSASLEFVEIWIGGAHIDKRYRSQWGHIRPKPGKRVTIAVVPQGGGGLRIAAMVGVMALAMTATVLVPGIGGALLGSAIMGGGMFAVNTFLPEPIPKVHAYSQQKAQAAYSITGGSNEVRPGAPVPVLLGRHKFTPPAIARYSQIRGQKVYWRVLLALSIGPVTDPVIFIGDTPLSEFDGVAVTFERGWHPKQLRDRGKWNPNAGFPTGRSAKPADKWTADRDAGRFKKGDVVVYNGIYSPVDERAWDINPGRQTQMFPQDPAEERFDVTLAKGEPVIRETGVGADEITVDFVCPQLGKIPSSSEKGIAVNYTVKLQIYEAAVEKPDDWRLVDGDVRITGGAGGIKETFGTHTWRASGNSPSKKYKVRVKRVNPVNDTLNDQVWSECKWFALRWFGDKKIMPALGISTLGVEVKGSDQLSGVLDRVNVVCQTLAWDWNGSAWVWRGTSNPFSLIRHIYQMPQWPEPLTDSQIDLERFEVAAAFATKHNLQFNTWVDYAVSNLHEFLGDIALAGFGALCRRNNKRSVALDPVEGDRAPFRLFVDGVNCWDATTRDILGEEVHAVRVNIADESKDWGPAERLICNDGYTEDTASRIKDMTLLGITDTTHATLIGRMKIADMTLRREETQLVTNIQGLSCEIGHVVGYASQSLAISTASGRISEVLLADDGETVAGVTLTHPVEMEDLGTYGLAYAAGSRLVTLAVITEPGVHDTVIFAQPPARAVRPAPDAVFAFGPSERQYMPLVVRNTDPDDEDNIRASLVALPPLLEELRKRLPRWESYATLPKALPTPVVTSVLSTAREMIVTAQGDLVTRVVISLAPAAVQGVGVVVMVRPSGVTDDYAIIQATRAEEGRISVIGLQDGMTYDFKVQYTHPDFFPSQATEVLSHRVAGKLDPPAAIANLRLVVISSTLARLHWDQPAELDVQYGGSLIVKHSPEMFAASWLNATSLSALDVSASQLSMIVPLMRGTYLVMTRDSSGNLSREFATVNTDGASIDEFDAMTDGTIVEEPLFLGARYNVGVQDGTLRLLRGSFDDVVDVDAMPNFDAIGLNVVNAGVYYFADTHDMGEVRRVRLRRRISQSPDVVGDLISLRMLPISQWPSISGTLGVTATDTIIEVRTTQGDPASADAIWTSWTRLDAGEFVCRAIQARAWLITEDGSYGVIVSNLQLFVEEKVL